MSYWYKYDVNFSDWNDTIWIRCFNLTDLLNEDEEMFQRHKKFESWKDLFWPVVKDIDTARNNFHSKNRVAKWIARNIIKMFFEIMMEDILDQKDTYRFPYQYFAQFGIREVPWNSKVMSLSISHNTEPMVIMSKGTRKRVGGFLYQCKLSQRYDKKLTELVDHGQRFPKLDIDGKR